MGLPWKFKWSELPTIYSQAKGHLYNLLSKLREQPHQLEIHDDIIKDQLESYFIEEVPGKLNHTVGHYLPHFAVTKDSETTPIRVVFNCSSRASRN